MRKLNLIYIILVELNFLVFNYFHHKREHTHSPPSLSLSRYGLWVHRYLPTMAKMPNQEKQYNTKPCETP